MSNNQKKEFLGFILIILIISPFIYISQYSFPSYDDYNFVNLYNKLGFIKTQLMWYFEWSGRYTSSAIIGIIHPMNFGYSGLFFYFVPSIVIIIGLVISLFRFISELFPTAEKSQKLFFLAGILFTYLFIMPSPVQGFYWLVGAWIYMLALITALEFSILLIKLNDKYSKRQLAFALIFAIILPGMCEIVDVLFISTYMLILFLTFIKKQSISKVNILVLIVFLIFTGVAFGAPGNGARAQTVVNSGLASKNLFLILFETVKIGFKYMFKWTFLSPMLVLFVFSGPILNHLREDFKSLISSRISLLILSFSVLFIVFLSIFPVLWSSGIAPDRIYNPIALFYLISVIISLYFWSKLIFKKFDFHLSTSSVIVISIFLFFYTIIGRNNFSRILIELKSGMAKNYAMEMRSQYQLCKDNPQGNIVFTPVKNRPNTIFINDLHCDSTHWENQSFSIFHGISSAKTIDVNSPCSENR
jgi:hypothetical protein